MQNYSEFPNPEKVRLGDTRTVEAFGKGTVWLKVKCGDVYTPAELSNVLYAPSSAKNLFSVSVVTKKGLTMIFDDGKCVILDSKGTSILGPLLFLIIFNDLTDVIENSKVLKYADDTVLYVSRKTTTDITEELNRDLSRLDKWLRENEHIMNFNKEKTEALLFGTANKIANCSSDFRPSVKDKEISKTASYTYFGIPIDSTLYMNTFFDKCYKKASSRLNLLAKLREDLDMKAAKAICQSMVLPTFTYCGILQLCNTKTQSEKLHSFHNRAKAIVNRNSVNRITLQFVTNANKKRACTLVRSCLDDNVIDPFRNYFQLIEHSIRTRNSSKIIRLPMIKAEYARESFSFTDAKEYNMLPLEAREISTTDFLSF